jgi:Cd2+/Zn2+-exporting ATPase
VKEYTLENLDCAACAARIEEALKKLDTVEFASVNFASAKLFLKTDDLERVRRRIGEIEPGVRLLEAKQGNEAVGFDKRRELATLGASIALFTLGMVFSRTLNDALYGWGAYLLFLPAYLLSGWKVLLKAVTNALRGRLFDENFLMTVATAGAFAIRANDEAAGVMIFFQIGELFQELSLNRSRSSIKALLDIKPKLAHKIGADSFLVDASPESISVGERIVVKPGERVPLDGTVLSGDSQVDTSPLTGEPVPKSVRPGDAVLAGMINKTGAFTLEVRRPYRESSVAKILQLVETSLEKKSKPEKFITRFARVYSPMVVGAAAAVAVLPPLFFAEARFSDWVYRALVLLVVSCPCALVISIPLGYFGGVGRAARRGILVKGSNFLDALGSVKQVVFDKTGTLTEGVFKVTDVVPSGGYARGELLELAASAESHSDHPIARSISESYGSPVNPDLVREYEAIGGIGVEALIGGKRVIVGNDRLLHDRNVPHDTCCVEGTVVHVAVDGVYGGHIVISDVVKSGSGEAVRALKELGVRSVGMLTGDNRYAAEAVAAGLDLDFVRSDLLPHEKVQALEEIMESGEKTAFVGDGVNDAPVIARADVGIAIGAGGSDAAIETADVVLMADSPLKVAEAVRTAKKTRSVVLQNIVLAFAVKGVFIALGIAGAATMWEAVFADMGVALLAIFNAMRILR